MKKQFTQAELELFTVELAREIDVLSTTPLWEELNLASDAQKLLVDYGRELVATNAFMNLTAITNPRDVAIRHFYDSLTIVPWLEKFAKTAGKGSAVNNLSPCSWIDVGTGAGFPGLAVQMVKPIGSLTLLDALRKRLNFLQKVAIATGVTKVQYLHARAEEAGQDKAYREQFDVAVARAVAGLDVLSELCLPLVKVGGHLIAMKGPNVEIEAGMRACKILGGEIIDVDNFTLPITAEQRNLVIIKKMKSTPKRYPRRAGEPNKFPL